MLAKTRWQIKKSRNRRIGKMVTIERGFTVKDVNDYKLVTERKERIVEDKRIVDKLKKVEFKNPNLIVWGYTKRLTQENTPAVLKNFEIFEIPNPFLFCKEDRKYNNLEWNLEQAVLALKEGYADGFYTSSGFFGHHTSAFKVVDPLQAVKVREYYLNEFKEWIEQIESNPFAYSTTISTSMRTFEIGTSKDPETPLESVVEDLKKWDSERGKELEGDYESRAKQLLEYMKYTSNICNIWGKWTANFLEFETQKEAEDFGKWLRREGGGYDDEDYIASGSMLVNHGFQKWLEEKRNSTT